MRRHKRRKQMKEWERTSFDDAATQFHKHLIGHMINLTPTGEDYQALCVLSRQMQEANKAITGHEPGWVHKVAGIGIHRS